MKKDVVPVDIRGILPANSGCAIFVGNDQKVLMRVPRAERQRVRLRALGQHAEGQEQSDR